MPLARIIDPLEVLAELPAPKYTHVKQFIIVGYCKPKSRPKFGKGRAYMPKEYEQCKEDFMIQFSDQAKGLWLVENCRLDFKFVGTFRGDPDNIMGTYLDAMVEVGIIKNDTLARLPRGQWEHFPGVSKVPFAVLDLYSREYTRPPRSKSRRVRRSSS